jgi:hypothetical protein
MMTDVRLFQAFSHAMCVAPPDRGTPYFDLSNPKILLGLLIGGMTPYVVVAILSLLTKRLLFFRVFKYCQPSFLRLCAVTLAELFCLLIAGIASTRLGSTALPLLIYAVLAFAANLVLLSSSDRHKESQRSMLRRSLDAFAAGLIYPGWFFLMVVVYLRFTSA